MTLTHRLKRRLGHDTETRLTESFELYEYEIEHTNGNTLTCRGNHHELRDGFLLCYEYPDVHLVDIGYPKSVSPSWSTDDWGVVGRYGSIEEWDRERVGTDEWEVVYDMADGDWEIVERPARLA